MNGEAVRELLKRQPFEAFDITLSSGQVVHVPHPEFVVFTKNGMVVAYPDSDRVSILAFLHIASIDTIARAQKA